MNVQAVAELLAEPGQPKRLDIYRQLARKGKDELPVGDIQTALDVPGSNLSHHITRLVSVELPIQRREARTLHCVPQCDELDSLIGFLREECCKVECCARARPVRQSQPALAHSTSGIRLV